MSAFDIYLTMVGDLDRFRPNPTDPIRALIRRDAVRQAQFDQIERAIQELRQAALSATPADLVVSPADGSIH